MYIRADSQGARNVHVDSSRYASRGFLPKYFGWLLSDKERCVRTGCAGFRSVSGGGLAKAKAQASPMDMSHAKV
jgi:hypothetical protein